MHGARPTAFVGVRFHQIKVRWCKILSLWVLPIKIISQCEAIVMQRFQDSDPGSSRYTVPIQRINWNLTWAGPTYNCSDFLHKFKFNNSFDHSHPQEGSCLVKNKSWMLDMMHEYWVTTLLSKLHLAGAFELLIHKYNLIWYCPPATVGLKLLSTNPQLSFNRWLPSACPISWQVDFWADIGSLAILPNPNFFLLSFLLHLLALFLSCISSSIASLLLSASLFPELVSGIGLQTRQGHFLK